MASDTQGPHAHPTVDTFLTHLPDPDAVGRPEYRLVYDFLRDLATDQANEPADETFDLMCAALDEIVSTAGMLKNKIAGHWDKRST